MDLLYDPRQPTSYIMEVNANNLDGWAMSQGMQDSYFEWLSKDECRDIKLLLNYEDGRIAIFDIRLFDHRENKEDKKNVILEVDLKYAQKIH